MYLQFKALVHLLPPVEVALTIAPCYFIASNTSVWPCDTYVAGDARQKSACSGTVRKKTVRNDGFTHTTKVGI